MAWEIEFTDEFEEWWNELTARQQDAVGDKVELLALQGPSLPFPHSSGVHSSRHGHMRELRAQSRGRPLRALYAFDPRRTAILLVGGDKTGNDSFYAEYVPTADRLYDRHLSALREEGLEP